ncbi:hypothetical protein [Streptomyces sp. 4F14]|uniref:hypothetical protein n=1 Tax=Streptomyces sp. 4F14 TaxID=3394380 RepID=UPI003A864046
MHTLALTASAALLLTGADPGLGVTVHRTDADVREGTRVHYTVDVTNPGDHPYPAAVVTQLMPGGMKYVTATPAGRASGNEVTWTVRVPAHGHTRITVTAMPGSPEAVREAQFVKVRQPERTDGKAKSSMSTTVCVRGKAGDRGTTCASDFAALEARPGAEGGGSSYGWLTGAAGLLGAAGVGGWWVLRRRREAAQRTA